MNGRSTGLDLNLQQQLRWVNMKNDSDASNCQLVPYLRRAFADKVLQIKDITKNLQMERQWIMMCTI